MKVAELRTELAKRNLDTTGLKSVLQARLSAAESAPAAEDDSDSADSSSSDDESESSLASEAEAAPPCSTVVSRAVVPEDGEEYQVVLGDSLRLSSGDGGGGGGGGRDFFTLRYEFKPSSVDEHAPGLMRRCGANDEVQLMFYPRSEGGGSAGGVAGGAGDSIHFRGREEPCKEAECVLLFVPPTESGERGHYRLESLCSTVRNLRHVAAQDAAATGLPTSAPASSKRRAPGLRAAAGGKRARSAAATAATAAGPTPAPAASSTVPVRVAPRAATVDIDDELANLSSSPSSSSNEEGAAGSKARAFLLSIRAGESSTRCDFPAVASTQHLVQLISAKLGLKLGPTDLEFWDKDFDEWTKISSLADLPDKAKLRVRERE